MFLSFVIPALNEEDNIARCLDSIVALGMRTDEYEVICVDNGSTDATPEIVKAYGNEFPVRFMSAPGVNLSTLRNIGARNSTGRILAFVDADCTVPSRWNDHVARHFEDGSVGAVGCASRIPEHASWIAQTWDLNNSKRRRLGETDSISTAGMATQRSAFDKIDGFDDGLVTNEDFDFCYRLRRAGFRIISDPETSVVHWGVPESLRKFYEREKWHGTHVLAVFWRNLPELRNARAVSYSFYCLFCLLALPVGLVVLIAWGTSWLLSVALILLVLPPIGLSIRTLSRPGKSYAHVLKLSVIYLVYGVARAMSMLSVKILAPRK